MQVFSIASIFRCAYFVHNFFQMNKLFQWIGSKISMSAKAIGDGFLNIFDIVSHSLGTWSRNKRRYQLMQVYRGWAYACILAKALEVEAIQLQLFEINNEGEKKEELKRQPMLELLQKINERMTKGDAFFLTSAHLDTYGKAYWKKVNFKTENKKIVILDPEEIEERYNEDDELIGYLRRFTTKKGKQKIEIIDVEDIIPFIERNPFNIDDGYSTLEAAFELIETEIYSTEWNRLFFKNNALPHSFIKTKAAISEKQKILLRESFNERHRGLEKAHILGILPPESDVVEMKNTHRDMDFSVLDERMQDKILGLFRTPRTVLGITTDVNRANAEATNFVYTSKVVLPRMRKIVETLNEFLTPDFGDSLFLDFKSPVPEDTERENETIKVALGEQPYMTVNEVRKTKGLPPVDGGDVVRGVLNMLPIGKSEENPEKEKSTKLKTQNVTTRYPRHRKTTGMIASGIVDRIEKIKKQEDEKREEERKERMHKEFVVRQLPFYEVLKRRILKVNKVFRKDFNKYFEKIIERVGKTKQDDDILFFNEEKQLELMIEAAGPPMKQTFFEEANVTHNLMGITEPFLISPELNRIIDSKIELLGNSYTDTMRENVGNVIRSGLKEGASPNIIRDRVNANVFDNMEMVRADLVADTEIFRMANSGIKESFRQSGVVKTVVWYTAQDDRVCEFCRSLHGKEIPIEKDFFSKGTIFEGDAGGKIKLKYDDVGAPPLHPSCRCVLEAGKLNIGS